MEKNGIIFSMIHRFKSYLIVDLVLFVIIGLVCWFGHYRTLEYYSNGLLIGGFIVWGIGFLSLMGGNSSRGGFTYQYLRNNNRDQRVQQDRAEMKQSNSFAIEMSILGVLPVGCGMLMKLMI